MKILPDKDWHSLEVEEIAAALETDMAKGLPEQEALRRLESFGFNELTLKSLKRRSPGRSTIFPRSCSMPS